MSNPIDRLSEAGVHRLPGPRPDGARDAARTGKPAEGGAHSADLLNLTGRAQELKALEKDLASEPAFDSHRVQILRQQIADGSYRIDPERIAEKLLAMEARLP